MELSWDARQPTHTATPLAGRQRQQRRHHERSKHPLTASNADNVFTYLPRYKVLLCLPHAMGVQNLDTHLCDHHGVPAQLRRAIVSKYRGYAIEKADQVALPAPMGPPMAALGTPVNAFQCTDVDCDYVSTNQDVFRRHCKTALAH